MNNDFESPDPQKEGVKMLAGGLARHINELMAEALCKKLKVDSVNVLDYKDRMARTPCGGGDIISLDAEPILFIQIIADGSPWLSGGVSQEIKFGVTIKWRFF